MEGVVVNLWKEVGGGKGGGGGGAPYRRVVENEFLEFVHSVGW